jgi:vacuolar-type H+-ATPase subunit D/Vma8
MLGRRLLKRKRIRRLLKRKRKALIMELGLELLQDWLRLSDLSLIRVL